MDLQAVLNALIEETGLSQAVLADRLGTTQATVSRWLRGSEPRGDKRDAIRAMALASGVISGDGARNLVPIMGFVGAGAEISPEFEQVPPDGLDQIELPFPVPEEMIAFVVKGDSMLPKYGDGDAIVVPRDPHQAIDNLIGDEAAVRTHDGHRFLKRIMRGSKRHRYNLESTNARTILDAGIAWASEIWVIVPAGRLRSKARRGSMARKS